jgi:hypothetical protein
VHLVLCVDKDKAMSWSDKQVVGRWHRLHRGTLLSQKFMRNELLSDNEWISLKETIVIYRQRLYDISWLRIKGGRVILNELYSYLLIKRGWFNGEKTTSF